MKVGYTISRRLKPSKQKSRLVKGALWLQGLCTFWWFPIKESRSPESSELLVLLCGRVFLSVPCPSPAVETHPSPAVKGAALSSLLLPLPRAPESWRFQCPGGAGVPDMGGLPEPGSEGTRTGTRVREAPSPLFLARPTVALSDPLPQLGP